MKTTLYDDGRLAVRWVNGRCVGFRVQHLEAIYGRDPEQVLRRHDVLEATERRRSSKVFCTSYNPRAYGGKKLRKEKEMARFWLTRAWV